MIRSEYIGLYRAAKRAASHFEDMANAARNLQEKRYFKYRAAVFNDEAKAWLEAHHKPIGNKIG